MIYAWINIISINQTIQSYVMRFTEVIIQFSNYNVNEIIDIHGSMH
jgi:hypothetical protein